MRQETDHGGPPDALAPGARGAAAGALAPATPTTRRLAAHSVSANTRAAYRCALRQFDTWRGAAPATDATLAAYLGWLFEQGRAPATAALGVAAVTFRATLAGTPVRGPQTARVLAGFRRDGADRGRGQAAPLRADGLAAILATADRPRVTGRGREAGARAARRDGPPGAGAPRRRPPRRRTHRRRGEARGRLSMGGDARGTGPPAPAGLRHPRLSVRGRTGRGASARGLGSRSTACAADAPVGRGSTTIPGGQAPPPSVTAARSPGRPGESGFGPLGPALAGQVRRARGRAVSRGADATPQPARRGRLGGRADRGPSRGTGDPCHAVLRLRAAAGPRRPAPRAPHAPPADWVVTPCRFGDTPHGGEPRVPAGRRGGGTRTGRATKCGSAVPEAAASATAQAGGVHGRRDRGAVRIAAATGATAVARLRPGRRRPSATRMRSTLSACAALPLLFLVFLARG